MVQHALQDARGRHDRLPVWPPERLVFIQVRKAVSSGYRVADRSTGATRLGAWPLEERSG